MDVRVLDTRHECKTFNEYLKLLGVEDTESYLKFNTVENDLNYDNIEELVALIESYKDKKITFLVDCDVDGDMSSGMMIDFLTKLGYNCDYIIHDKNPKAHGLDDDEVMRELKEREPSLLIIPDAGTNDAKQCKKLVNLGWKIGIADHHQKTEENEYAVIVNCQTSEKVVNKSASGTLVAWHVMHLMNPRLANEYISYVAISIISDRMSFLTNENITFIYRGLATMHPNLKDLVDSVQKDYYPMSFSFGGLVPKCNATIRLGNAVEKKCLFNVLSGIDKDSFDIERVSGIIKHYHSLQNTLTNSILEENVSIDDENEKVLLCKLNIKTPLTGLVANKLMGKCNKPVFMVHERADNNCDGSVRSPIPIRDILNDSGLFNYNSGHNHAFGTSYKMENEEQVKDFLYNLELPKPCFDVLSDKWDIKDIEPFGDLKRLWGNDLVEPQYYQRVIIKSKDISVIGASKTTIKFKIGNVTYIKFFCNHEWIEELMGKDYFELLKNNSSGFFTSRELVVEMIGKGQWNEWNGNRYPQFLIDRMEFREFGFDDLF